MPPHERLPALQLGSTNVALSFIADVLSAIGVFHITHKWIH